MSSTNKERFRITAWPGVIPTPPIHSAGAHVLIEHVLAPVRDQTEPARRRPTASGETYLRLVDLDLEDEKEILQFVNEFGILGITETFDSWRSFALEPRVERALEESRKQFSHILIPGYDFLDHETLEEFRIGARLIRDGLTAWRVLRGELEEDAAQWESLFFEPREYEYRPMVDAQDYLTELCDIGLIPFHPTIFIDRLDMKEEPQITQRMTVGEGDVRAMPSRGTYLFPICCLELYNHIVAQASYLTCANEPCGRLFVRQSGRAEHGQFRNKGVKYCSASCAKAQAQRVYRRKKRSA